MKMFYVCAHKYDKAAISNITGKIRHKKRESLGLSLFFSIIN
jgi:hypothetical protein